MSSILRRLSEIDFSLGFHSFRAVWREPRINKIAYFETSFPDGNVFIRWRLRYIVNKNEVKFILRRRDLDFKKVPAVCRLVLFNDAFENYFTEAKLNVYDGADDELILIVSSRENILNFGDFSIICFVDIPKCASNFSHDDENIDDISSNFKFSSPEKLMFKKFLEEGLISAGEFRTDFDLILICVNENQEFISGFSCHRKILCENSAVFDRMLGENCWMETNDARNIVKIPDLDTETVENFLRYLYGTSNDDEKLEFGSLSCEQVENLIYAADKYDVPYLKSNCLATLVLYFDSDERRLTQLDLAQRHNLEGLEKICAAQLCTNLKIFKDSDIPTSVRDAASRKSMACREVEVRDKSKT